MADLDNSLDAIFQPCGRLRTGILNEAALEALKESVRLAKETHYDGLRSPHIFMGLLAVPDQSVVHWGERIQTDLKTLLSQFQELFHQEQDTKVEVLALNREFLSNRVIGLLRDAKSRATDHNRSQITPMDLLISLLTASNSLVGECFERVGVTAAKLTEMAVISEYRMGNQSESETC